MYQGTYTAASIFVIQWMAGNREENCEVRPVEYERAE